MTCAGFERWLDDGMPNAGSDSAQTHAVRCARCTQALAAALEVERFLEIPPVPAPAGFADRVMARVEASTAVQGSLVTPSPTPAFAWWVRAAAEPAVVLALGLAGLLVWKRDALLVSISGMLVIVGQIVSGAPRLAPSLTTLQWIPALTSVQSLGLAIALAPALILGSFALYRWTERLAARPAHRALSGSTTPLRLLAK